MKHVIRIIISILAAAAAVVVINAKTRFFKDIGTNLPFIGDNFPELAWGISELSDELNEQVYRLPSPAELFAMLRHTELPIDPDDIATNVHYSSDTMINFYNNNNVSVAVSGNELDVYGVMGNSQSRYLAYQFLSQNGDVLGQFTDTCDANGNYRKVMTIPDGTYQFTVYTGHDAIGEYSSAVYNYIFLQEDENGVWSVSTSPVYEHNLSMYEKNKSKSAALASRFDICSDELNVISLAQSITQSCGSDYEKALAIHDWVCKNIYYDEAAVRRNGTNDSPRNATDVIAARKAVCLGYSNLYAALCRAVGIPCNVITGYAISEESEESTWTEKALTTAEANHAWNEAYIDNRWVIVDTTWDSKNKLIDGRKETSDDISYLYFDANIRFFSQNHKIIEYISD